MRLNQQGKKVLVLDSGMRMSMGQKLFENYPAEAKNAVLFQLLHSEKPELFPSTRTLSWAGGKGSFSHVVSMAEIPKTMGRATHYVRDPVSNRISPFGPAKNDEGDLKAVISKAEVQRMLEDLKYTSEEPEIKRQILSIKAVVSKVTAAARKGSRQETARILNDLVARPEKYGFSAEQARLIVTDWLDAYRINPPLGHRSFELTINDLKIPEPARIKNPCAREMLSAIKELSR